MTINSGDKVPDGKVVVVHINGEHKDYKVFKPGETVEVPQGFEVRVLSDRDGGEFPKCYDGSGYECVQLHYIRNDGGTPKTTLVSSFPTRLPVTVNR
jgi:hypothetical protein